MRDGDLEQIEVGLWVGAWVVASPVLLLLTNEILTSEEYQFACPWLVVGFSHLGGAALLGMVMPLLECCSKRPADLDVAANSTNLRTVGAALPPPSTVDVRHNQDQQKQVLIRTVLLSIFEALEVGMGAQAQLGVTLALRNVTEMLSPLVVAGVGVYLGTEKQHRELLIVAALASLGGMLATPGVWDFTDWTMPPMALIARLIAVAKWILARVWLTSLDPQTPTPASLALRMLTTTGCLCLEATWLFSLGGGYGPLFSMPEPMKVARLILGMSFCIAILIMAELKVLRLTSATLLGFLVPFRCSVLLLANALWYQKATWHWLGLVVVAVATAGYAALKAKETGLAQENRTYMQLPEVSKTVIARGDDEIFPRPGDQVMIKYVGTFPQSGQIFDSGDIQFTVGKRQVIEGWDVGVRQMSLGEKAILEVPHAYAYGRKGRPGLIPPSQNLTFRVHLMRIGNQKSPGCAQM